MTPTIHCIRSPLVVTLFALVPALTACNPTGLPNGGDPTGTTLAPTGTVTDACGPADGPAMQIRIGTGPSCPAKPGAEPQLYFYIWTGRTDSLAPGLSWAAVGGISQQMSVEWLPTGVGGTAEKTRTIKLEVLSVTPPRAKLRYELVTADGVTWSGDAVVDFCKGEPLFCS